MDTNQLVTIASTRPNDQKTQSLQVKEEEPTTMTTTTTSRSTNSENNENRGPTLSFNEIKECHLQWTNIIKCVETSGLPIIDPKTTLNQISGEAKPGEIIALMGPSGSGKTSLLDVLASRSTYDVGKIYLNETSMTDNPSMMKALKRKIAYIEQKEIFLEHLTVKDQLDYTAKLRLGDDYSEEEQLNEVDKIIRLLRLEKCADTKIRLVSG
jgi:ABC-type multidrug transport system ATPase subunit